MIADTNTTTPLVFIGWFSVGGGRPGKNGSGIKGNVESISGLCVPAAGGRQAHTCKNIKERNAIVKLCRLKIQLPVSNFSKSRQSSPTTPETIRYADRKGSDCRQDPSA
jgi:hypothetical protein